MSSPRTVASIRVSTRCSSSSWNEMDGRGRRRRRPRADHQPGGPARAGARRPPRPRRPGGRARPTGRGGPTRAARALSGTVGPGSVRARRGCRPDSRCDGSYPQGVPPHRTVRLPKPRLWMRDRFTRPPEDAEGTKVWGHRCVRAAGMPRFIRGNPARRHPAQGGSPGAQGQQRRAPPPCWCEASCWFSMVPQVAGAVSSRGRPRSTRSLTEQPPTGFSRRRHRGQRRRPAPGRRVRRDQPR